ncbi:MULTISPECIES: nucleoside-diphosphate sugar epimerase/dehydratase [unclassified Bacillus (in: firmicutes)]|uniref:polysaccharide biosynthesis protein n=1 Tax=unclassified Bacillus (in: firmicutes) TaxID=185979 RepID=UPI0008E61EC0|nr:MULTISPECIES: nucleoside-diphosphate sugar epimerase/dehydratase [unclassified Bacillus (in: firmicutes)]SFI28597.1 NDP-sugar epimerase, includes UDP-GlcNAc-inverting 4,6-dehydratase FlaA1 and capsular polysaccharide biosynthesis protein EpsC [Bacillus sp. 71mf]SFS39336.1 NDP-sugar epimerase, includes UDP-GlcNAc-inverting 4,6-dehydratase FlaA1 and capsular polysaccharide biosynthesis protein EpsC [Bacillus sp. 103mf]
MTYRQRLSLLLLMDSLIVLGAIYFSYFFVNGSFRVITLTSVISSITLLLSHHFFAFLYKLYKKAWEYASIGELLIIFKAITLTIVTTAFVQKVVIHEVYFRLLAVTWMIHILLIGGSRFIWRMFRDAYFKNDDTKKRTLIIGAGSAGTMVVRQLLQNNDTELLPVAFIDDNVKKHNLDILGIPVIGGVNQIERVVEELNIESIIIAIPSLRKKRLNAIFKECSKTKAKTQILPMLEDLVTGKVSVNEFRDVQVEDLLGRSPVELDMNSISEYITDKVILVTGAGGSIGSEICRQVAKFNPKQLILLGHGENSIYSIEMELRELYGNTEIIFIPEIADIQDSQKMMSVMNKYHPHVVYHAAAHKHVPLMEYNPEEAVKNNLMGTMNVAKAASWHDVETFVMISSDKAVNPTNVMGATKRLAEMIVQYTNKTSHTKFVAVRFGNVLGSRGSVIPLFKKQIQKGGPVTVTHPDMVRYFMTIPEASRLVMQAGALAKGGEIFVLDMGEPVKIVDLAKNLIKLSGNSVEEIGIEFTGTRPGEKLFEELLKDDEMIEQQIYPRIYVGKETNIYIEEIEKIISTHSDLDKEELRNILLDLANKHNASKILTPTLG